MADRSPITELNRPAGDVEAVALPEGAPSLAVLYERHWAELVRYVRRTFGNGPPEPEDVVQAAFTHFAALVQPQLVENPRAFLYRASRNLVIDHRRRSLVRSRSAQRGEIEQLSDSADELNAERVLTGKSELRILDETIKAMPARLRDPLILHRIHELSYAEVARRLGTSQTSVKRSVAEAILLCARALRAANGEDGSR